MATRRDATCARRGGGGRARQTVVAVGGDGTIVLIVGRCRTAGAACCHPRGAAHDFARV